MIRATGLTGWASGPSGKGKKDAMFESDRSMSVVIEDDCRSISFEADAYDGHWSGTLTRGLDGRMHGSATSKDLELNADAELTLAHDPINSHRWVIHGVWLEEEEKGGVKRKFEWWGEFENEV